MKKPDTGKADLPRYMGIVMSIRRGALLVSYVTLIFNAKIAIRYSKEEVDLVTFALAEGVNKGFYILVYRLGQPHHRPVATFSTTGDASQG